MKPTASEAHLHATGNEAPAPLRDLSATKALVEKFKAKGMITVREPDAAESPEEVTPSANRDQIDPRPDNARDWLTLQPRIEPRIKLSIAAEELFLLTLWHGAYSAHDQWYELGIALSVCVYGVVPAEVPQFTRLRTPHKS